MKSKRRGYKKEQKSYLTHENYIYIYKHLWYNNFYDYIYKGYRIDNSNLLNIYSFILVRLAEIY